MNKFYRDVTNHTRNAINRTLTQCAKEQRKMIKEKYALKDKKIKNLSRVTRATTHRLQGSIKSLKVSLSLNNFTRIESKQGVRVRISKNKSIFFKGAFLGVRRGESKKDKKNKGFLSVRKESEALGFETNQSYLKSYKNRKSPKESKIFYLKTKPFSKIATESNPNFTLQKKAIEIFKIELSKE